MQQNGSIHRRWGFHIYTTVNDKLILASLIFIGSMESDCNKARSIMPILTSTRSGQAGRAKHQNVSDATRTKHCNAFRKR